MKTLNRKFINARHKFKLSKVKALFFAIFLIMFSSFMILMGVTFSIFNNNTTLNGNIYFDFNCNIKLDINNDNISQSDLQSLAVDPYTLLSENGITYLTKTNTFRQNYGELPDPSSLDDTMDFVGWWTTKDLPNTVSSGTHVTDIMVLDKVKDVTLYGKWNYKRYNITYDLDGGMLENVENPSSYTSFDSFTLNNPTRDGYTFQGWTGTDLNEATTTVTIANGSTGDREYTANWTPINYTITYNGLENATLSSENPTTYTIENTDITLNNPTKDGYNFKGWSGTDLTGDTNTTVTITSGSTGDRSYTANWEELITITYHMNANGLASTLGLSGTSTESTYIDEWAENYVIPTELRTSNMQTKMTALLPQVVTGTTTLGSLYTFDGWYTTKNFANNSKITNPASPGFSEETDLYAKWIINSTNAPTFTTNVLKLVNTNQIHKIEYDWDDNTSLISVVIPAEINGTAVTGIGESGFCKCTNLTSVTIPGSVTIIEDYAFSECSGLISIEIPSGVTSIGADVFSYCIGLTEITIPSSVTSIEGYAFYQCGGLTEITIPSSVTSIGDSSFRACSGLTSITIPSSVTSIGNSAFSSCSGLTSITVDLNNTKYDSRDNCNAIIETSTNILIAGCQNTTIPSSVIIIEGYAFYECIGLTSIEIPSSVTSIGESAFEGCSGLTSVIFGENSQLTSIGERVFEFCSELTSVIFGENSHLTSIGERVFECCSELTSITIPNSVTSIGSDAFSGCSKLATVYLGTSSASKLNSIGGYAFDGTALTSAKFYVTSGWKAGGTSLNESDLSDVSKAATYLKTTYVLSSWTRS